MRRHHRVPLILWELGSRSKQLFGYALPYVGLLPAPSDVAVAWSKVLTKRGYWESWYQSFKRVLTGLPAAAQMIGIPFGLMLAVNRYFREIFFPALRGAAPDPAAGLGAGLADLLADQRDVDRVRHLPRRVLHDRDQRAGRRTHHRCALPAGRAVDGREPVGFVLEYHPAGHVAVDLHGRRGRHGHHLGGRGGRRDDLRVAARREAAASAFSSGIRTWADPCRRSSSA